MQNTYTWDSDYALLFLFCLMLPIALHFLGAILSNLSQNRPVPKPSKPSKPHNQSPPSISISVSLRDFPSNTTTKTKQRPKKKAKPRLKRPQPPQPPKPLTSGEIINDSISALYSLGTDKREATRIVKSLSSKKEYNSAESLIKDALCV